MEEVKEVFLLYHTKRIPMAMVHMTVSTNRANMSFETMKMDNPHQYSQGHF